MVESRWDEGWMERCAFQRVLPETPSSFVFSSLIVVKSEILIK